MFLLFLRVLSASVQLLDSVSKKPASEDETFSKKKIVEKKNRYKDRFPCELQHGKLVCNCCHGNETLTLTLLL